MDKIAIELSKLSFIKTINSLKEEIDNDRPFPTDVEDRIFQTLRLRWNYESNAIEGNKYTFGETVTLIMEGLTAFGKTRKDADDIEGHNEALKYMLSLIKDERDFSETDIRDLHKIILVKPYKTKAKTIDGQPTSKTVNLGEYKKLPNHVETSSTGEIHYYATPEETPAMMTDLMNWYDENKQDATVHPLTLASLFHHKFVVIHPFDDGNGRLARILMNLILMRKGFPPIIVKNDDKLSYYNVLNLANRNLYKPLVEYMSELLQHSLNIYLKGINGESIEEESDIDKEIALFVKGFNKNDYKVVKNKLLIEQIFTNNLFSMFDLLDNKLNKLDELFEAYKREVKIDIYDEESHSFKTEEIYKWNSNLKLLSSSIEYPFKNEILKSYYTYTFKKFKANSNLFNFEVLCEIIFNNSELNIIYKNNSITKYYNETISPEEINTFVTTIMKDILNEIKQETNNNSYIN